MIILEKLVGDRSRSLKAINNAVVNKNDYGDKKKYSNYDKHYDN